RGKVILRNSEKRSLENDIRTRIPSVDFPLENQGSRAVSYLCHISHYAWLRFRLNRVLARGVQRPGQAKSVRRGLEGHRWKDALCRRDFPLGKHCSRRPLAHSRLIVLPGMRQSFSTARART